MFSAAEDRMSALFTIVSKKHIKRHNCDVDEHASRLGGRHRESRDAGYRLLRPETRRYSNSHNSGRSTDHVDRRMTKSSAVVVLVG
jgi:hypothetical protein